MRVTVLVTHALRQEPLVELLKRSRVVHPTDWMVIFARLSILHQRERSGYTLLCSPVVERLRFVAPSRPPTP